MPTHLLNVPAHRCLRLSFSLSRGGHGEIVLKKRSMIIRIGNPITTRIDHLRFFCCGCEAPPAGVALAAAAGCLLVVPAKKLAISKLAIGLAAAALPLLARCASNSALNSGSTVHNLHLAPPASFVQEKGKRGEANFCRGLWAGTRWTPG